MCAVALAAATGCNGGEDFAGGLDGDGDSTGAASAPEAAPTSTCGVPTPPARLADPSSLPACAPACGGAHCVPADKVPASSQSFFAACGGGFCLPDPLIESGGARPPSCKSVGGADGVCLSTCVPEVAMNKDVLAQGSCGQDERCAPCNNPQDGKSTGACEIGSQLVAAPGSCKAPTAPAPAVAPVAVTCPHVGPPVLDPATLPACGGANSGAHCLPTHLAPTELVAKLATCPTGVCVPDKLIVAGGHFIPATCSSLLGAEGRCQSIVLPSIAGQASLPVATCDANERCAPCASPVDGSDTGSCKTSCDTGAKTAGKTFANCCNKNGATVGKCVPKTNIPSSISKELQGDVCQNDSLCVPTENLLASFTPQACKGSPTFADDYTGVCLSDCLDFGFGSSFVLDKGNCSKSHTCIPCMKDGKPTGAPGCPS